MRLVPESVSENSPSWPSRLWRTKLRLRKRKQFNYFILLFLLFVATLVIFSFDSTGDQRQLNVVELKEDETGGALTDIRHLKYRLWPDDRQCEKHVVQFIRNCDRPPVALVSYPGSGNTYVRGIIERLTGYFTGSVYRDSFIYQKGFSLHFSTLKSNFCSIFFHRFLRGRDAGWRWLYGGSKNASPAIRRAFGRGIALQSNRPNCHHPQSLQNSFSFSALR